MTYKRGRLASGGPPLSKEQYKCKVENCQESFRGDLIPDHFRRKSKLAVLDEAKKLDVSSEITNGINQISTLLINDENQKKHTLFC